MTKNKEMSLAEIEKLRKSVDADIWLATVAIAIRLLIACVAYVGVKSDSEMVGWFSAVIGIGSGVITFAAVAMLGKTFKDFQLAWSAFYLRRYLPFLRSFVEDGYYAPWSVSRWRFYMADDLVEFERTLLDGLRAARTTIDRERKLEKWHRVGLELRSQLDVLLDTYKITDGRVDIYAEFFEYENPRRKRDFLNRLAQQLAYESWCPSETTTALEKTTAVKHVELVDVELRSFEAMASQVTDQTAQIMVKNAEKLSSRREKIRLLGQALQLDQKAMSARFERQLNVVPVVEPTTREQKEASKRITLGEFCRERLASMQSLVDKDVDWQMCREILLVLLEPGRKGARFNKHYFAEDTVSTEVRRRYQVNVGGQFSKITFDRSVKYLLGSGVLVSKPKTDERTLSLSTRAKGAQNPQAAEIIAAVLHLKQELNGFV